MYVVLGPIQIEKVGATFFLLLASKILFNLRMCVTEHACV
jgi:hypothetical protein